MPLVTTKQWLGNIAFCLVKCVADWECHRAETLPPPTYSTSSSPRYCHQPANYKPTAAAVHSISVSSGYRGILIAGNWVESAIISNRDIIVDFIKHKKFHSYIWRQIFSDNIHKCFSNFYGIVSAIYLEYYSCSEKGDKLPP